MYREQSRTSPFSRQAPPKIKASSLTPWTLGSKVEDAVTMSRRV